MMPLLIYFILTCSNVFTVSSKNNFRECGLRYESGRYEPTIIYGSSTKHNEFPWHTGLYRQLGPTNFQYICGGSIVHQKAILTAAHCIYDDNDLQIFDEPIFAVVGKYNSSWNQIDENEQRFKVIRKEIPTTYLGLENKYADDIALLSLNDSIDFSSIVMPICIDWDYDFKFYETNKLGTIVGWGFTENDTVSDKLLWTKLQYYNTTTCREKVDSTFTEYITSDKFCAGLDNGTGVAGGDSGGGLCYPRNTTSHKEQYFVYGVVSVRDSQGSGVAAFTDISKHILWLNRTLKSIIDGNKQKVCGKVLQYNITDAAGKNTTGEAYPWFASVYVEETINPSRLICSGTIIHQRAIITASGCLSDEYGGRFSDPTFSVFVGRLRLNRYIQEPDVIKYKVIRVHEKGTYAGMNNEDDITIFELEEDIKFSNSVMPICIDWDRKLSLNSNTNIGTVQAWDKSLCGSKCDEPFVSKYRYYGLSECRKNFAKGSAISDYISHDKVCGEFVNGTILYRGLGGGFIFEPDSGHYLFGIVSSSLQLTVLTFTNVHSHLGWITSVLNSIA